MKLHILSPWQFKNLRLRKLNEKTENQSYDYGCIMGYFNLTDYEKLNSEIGDVKDEDVYDNENKEYGREIEPHVTILYGLHDEDIEEEEVITLLKSIKLPTVQLTEISCFNNEKYDVLKWDVESEYLNIFNKIVTTLFPYTNKFPDYHAHCTIAYLIPGKGESYSKKIDVPQELQILKWVYSKADGKKISVDDKGNVEVIAEADSKEEPVQENKQQDYSYDFKGYRIQITESPKFKNRVMCSVYKNNEYQMGLKGPVTLESAKQAAELFVNGTIAKS